MIIIRELQDKERATADRTDSLRFGSGKERGLGAKEEKRRHQQGGARGAVRGLRKEHLIKVC